VNTTGVAVVVVVVVVVAIGVVAMAAVSVVVDSVVVDSVLQEASPAISSTANDACVKFMFFVFGKRGEIM
jgi:hypothetical protein